MAASPRVFTIAPTTPFLPALARGLMDGVLIPGFAPRKNPALLADATIYLPTRRAARALSRALLDELNTGGALLPKIVPLGDVDEDAFAFEFSDLEPLAPAIDPAARRLALARLIVPFAKSSPGLLPASPPAAITLADELAHLMDDFITAGKPFGEVKHAVEGEFDKYWERSRDFLELVDDGWRKFLSERGLTDSATRRDALLAREARRLESNNAPVIAAGSTGTLPKVAELLRVIAHRQNGAVILPGLDQDLEEAAFKLIGRQEEPLPGHPQFGLKRLIERIGVARKAVVPLGSPENPAREKMFSAAFRPMPEEDAKPAGPIPDALKNIAIVDAADSREEALTIAILLRETLASDDSTAALITPDRALARRVCAELTRWHVAVDDSAGLPLADSETGRFARLIAEAAEPDAAPVTLLALLRHPHLHARFAREDVDLFEVACLRGPRPAGGAGAIVALIDKLESTAKELHSRDRRRHFHETQWGRAKAVARAAVAILQPLLALGGDERDFATLVAAHREAFLAAIDAQSDEASSMVEAFDELLTASRDAPKMRLHDYADAFPALIRERTVRPAPDPHARIRILGPLEARMISASRIVLGGLNEGVWPPEAHSDSWLNRPMRKALKLDLPERRIGLSAHDFVQACGAPEVFLVRARKQNGVETIASRFLQRMLAIADDKAVSAARELGEKYLGYARSIERAEAAEPLKPPRPAPRADIRPTQFSVSDVKDLVRDPYSIFAKHILKLAPLDPVDKEPDPAQRGTLLHEILSEFAKAYPDAFPPHAKEELIRFGRAAFAKFADVAAAQAIWWPRFERVADWFVNEERKRREKITRILSEISGRVNVDAGGIAYVLTARADRIDIHDKGTISILDYKTGTPPTYKQSILGFEPQLLLEAAIARNGGFPGIARGVSIAAIGPVKLSGKQPPGEFKLFEFSTRPDFAAVSTPRGINEPDHLDKAADYVFGGLKALFAKYGDPSQPYLSAPRAKWSKDYNDYAHLARIKEWSAGDGE
jgi:ATP-dependent helicase/nuclease subunit B